MRAVIKGFVIATNDDIVMEGGYAYFPGASVGSNGWRKPRRRYRITPAPTAFNSTTW